MADLFEKQFRENIRRGAPLADRIRPKSFDDYVGQDHIIGFNSLLRKAIENDDVPSMIFWGPPGSGKTTLAKIIPKTAIVEKPCFFIHIFIV